MKQTSMCPLGMAMAEYYRGGDAESLFIVREDGYIEECSVAGMFDQQTDSEIEQAAIAMCDGKVLDVGAGAGKHSIIIQNRGLSVEAVDILPEAVDIMKQRGVKNARCMNIWDICQGCYDTVIMLSHGLGMVGNIDGLGKFLRLMVNHLSPGGKILADSMDVTRTDNPAHLEYHSWLRAQGQYHGEMTLQLRYKENLGRPFKWLHMDFDTLRNIAAKNGFDAEQVKAVDRGDYLCRLSPRA